MSRAELIRYLRYLHDTFVEMLRLNQLLLAHPSIQGALSEMTQRQDLKIRTMIQILYNLLNDPTLGKKTRKYKKQSNKNKDNKNSQNKRNSQKNFKSKLRK
jgi:hypothetical protein